MDIKDLYLKIRRRFLEEKVEFKDSKIVFPSNIAGRSREIAETLVKKLLGIRPSSVDTVKNIVRRRLSELPFGVKRYNWLKKCRVVEISFESGVHGSHILSPYLKRASYIYIASPFMDKKDIDHIYWLARPVEPIIKILTNKKIDHDKAEIRYLPIHAKFLVTDKIAMLGSMNFNMRGLSSAISHEVLFITEDEKFVKDLTDRFLWWWDLAGEIEEIRVRKII